MVSLNNLIVRDIANQERGMYLISASTPPEMYELYAPSKDERRTWMNLIQQTAVRSGQQYSCTRQNFFVPSCTASGHRIDLDLIGFSLFAEISEFSVHESKVLSTSLGFLLPKVSKQRRVSPHRD